MPVQKEERERVRSISEELRSFITEQGRSVRIIYRTCQTAFGHEGPRNLVPRQREANRITVFLDFRNRDIACDSLRRVIAFPESHIEELPPPSEGRFHALRVDLEKTPSRYVFLGLDDLKRNWARVLL